VNFSSFRVSSRPHQPQQQQQQLQTSHGGRIARAVVTGGGRLVSASAFGNAPPPCRQQQPNGTGATVSGSRKNRKPSSVACSAAGTTALRYCKSVSPIVEKPPARRSPPRSVSMNLQPRNSAPVDPCPRWSSGGAELRRRRRCSDGTTPDVVQLMTTPTAQCI